MPMGDFENFVCALSEQLRVEGVYTERNTVEKILCELATNIDAIINEMPKNLSDFENDLFYSKPVSFVALIKDDFEAWEDPDGNIEYIYTLPYKIDWLTSAESIDWSITESVEGQQKIITKADVSGAEQYYSDTTSDGGTANTYVCDFLCVCTGFDYKKSWDEFVSKDETTIELRVPLSEADSLTLNIQRIDSKKIPYECLDLSKLEQKIAGISAAGATVGQVLAVKAVDENGKPTEWEYVNLA